MQWVPTVLQSINTPYCGVHVAPHIADQSRDTNNRHHPLDNSGAKMEQKLSEDKESESV